jgi:hypothetical protein
MLDGWCSMELARPRKVDEGLHRWEREVPLKAPVKAAVAAI